MHSLKNFKPTSASHRRIEDHFEEEEEVFTNVGLVYSSMHGLNNNINNGIKEPTCGYQNCITNQIMICGGYVKVRESLYT